MNVLEAARKRPKLSTAGLTAASVIGFFYAWDKLSPTLEFTVALRNAPAKAEAALKIAQEADQKAGEAREWIDRYIEDQQQQRAFDQQLAEQAAEYQRQMLELQRQQQVTPNQAAPRQQGLREWDASDGRYYCCESEDRAWCWEGHWYECE